MYLKNFSSDMKKKNLESLYHLFMISKNKAIILGFLDKSLFFSSIDIISVHTYTRQPTLITIIIIIVHVAMVADEGITSSFDIVLYRKYVDVGSMTDLVCI